MFLGEAARQAKHLEKGDCFISKAAVTMEPLIQKGIDF
jgi:hypothetical protein